MMGLGINRIYGLEQIEPANDAAVNRSQQDYLAYEDLASILLTNSKCMQHPSLDDSSNESVVTPHAAIP